MQSSSSTETYIPVTSISSGIGQSVTSDLYCFPIQVVNICLFGDPNKTDKWVLVDAGMPKSADKIVKAAEERFGKNHQPQSIILTHGHFDHVGGILDLVDWWKMPVYAHELELPYLTGEKNYPEPDPTVEGGLVAKMSAFFPNESIDLGEHVQPLPSNGSIPEMNGWRWIHTPGHTRGHVSLFREKDRALIAGDAFVTVRQDSLYQVITQEQEVHGPPRYFTTDWQAARESVKILRSLKPTVAITGHGFPMSGELLSEGLDKLVKEFDTVAIPDYGKYVK